MRRYADVATVSTSSSFLSLLVSHTTRFARRRVYVFILPSTLIRNEEKVYSGEISRIIKKKEDSEGWNTALSYLNNVKECMNAEEGDNSELYCLNKQSPLTTGKYYIPLDSNCIAEITSVSSPLIEYKTVNVSPPLPIQKQDYLDSASFLDVFLALLIFFGTMCGGLVVGRKIKCLKYEGYIWGVDWLSGEKV